MQFQGKDLICSKSLHNRLHTLEKFMAEVPSINLQRPQVSCLSPGENFFRAEGFDRERFKNRKEGRSCRLWTVFKRSVYCQTFEGLAVIKSGIRERADSYYVSYGRRTCTAQESVIKNRIEFRVCKVVPSAESSLRFIDNIWIPTVRINSTSSLWT